jgi:hypothetical protein
MYTNKAITAFLLAGAAYQGKAYLEMGMNAKTVSRRLAHHAKCQSAGKQEAGHW